MQNALKLLEAAAHKRVLFVGETIRDVYHYVRPLGRPMKDAIVSVEHIETEEFMGGVIAASKHAEPFVMHAEVFTDGDAIQKIRYVEQSHIRKLFEVYRLREGHPPEPPFFGSPYDAVIVTDYGHGFMTARLVEAVCHEAHFLAVNVQTNSGNYGYNLATKYPGADYLCVDEPEARLATQNRTGDIESSLRRLAQIAAKVVITLGKNGAIGFDREEIVRVPAFTDAVVDTIGAGDAFFAVTAPLAEEADMATLLRIGNAAGAIKAGIVGHRGSVTKEALLELLRRAG